VNDNIGTDEVARVVRDEIARLLERTHRAPVQVADADRLDALGISSIELFDLAGGLEERLGVDPFEGSYSLSDVRTVDDLCRAYCDACSDSAGRDETLQSSRRRAEARRRQLR